MLSVEPILERTFFKSGMGAWERGFLGARGTGGFFSSTVCLGTGGLVMRVRRGVPLVVAGVAESGVGVWLVLGRAEFKTQGETGGEREAGRERERETGRRERGEERERDRERETGRRERSEERERKRQGGREGEERGVRRERERERKRDEERKRQGEREKRGK